MGGGEGEEGGGGGRRDGKRLRLSSVPEAKRKRHRTKL